MLRQRPRREPEEAAEEREVAGKEGRLTEALSEIEVTASTVPCKPQLWAALLTHTSLLTRPRPDPGAQVSVLALSPAGPEGGPGAQWSPHALFR